MWSGSRVAGRQSGNQNCIFAATSPMPAGPFTAVTSGSFTTGLCDSDHCTAYLDPDIFLDSRSGQYWLYFSKQTYAGVNCQSGGQPAGEIWGQRVSSDGIRLVRSTFR